MNKIDMKKSLPDEEELTRLYEKSRGIKEPEKNSECKVITGIDWEACKKCKKYCPMSEARRSFERQREEEERLAKLTPVQRLMEEYVFWLCYDNERDCRELITDRFSKEEIKIIEKTTIEQQLETAKSQLTKAITDVKEAKKAFKERQKKETRL